MSPLLQEVLKQVEQLTPEDQRELIRQVSSGLASQAAAPPQAKRSWRELRGIAPNLLNGQDAQEWVNELRSEWDERENRLRGDV